MVYLTAPGSSILVLNSLPVITDLLDRRSSNFSDRFQLPAFELIKMGWNFGLLPYGSRWRAHRREFQQLVGQNAVTRYRPVIRYHTAKYLRGLLKAPEHFVEATKSLFGQTIIHLAYGVKDEDYVKKQIHMAEENIRGHITAMIPGRYLVNTIPVLHHVPAWFPGAAWKRDFNDLAAQTEEMTLRPFEDAKERMVSQRWGPGRTYKPC
ncbi:cytochrome P450 [Coprinopsis sp. MPI-PUGE-AT-0042]|nr:cytochrome P450 [Coprinopsis sp. MPI-PUGE-AT-0042]